MSTTAPWNIQTAAKDSGNVKLFNPLENNTALQNGPIPQTDGSQQASWNTGWGTDNQYGQYNNIVNSDGQHMQQSADGNNQNEYQNQQYESQQFYNLNPGIQPQPYNEGIQPQPYNEGIQPQLYNEGQYTPQCDAQGQPVQQWATNNEPVQPFDPQGQYTQQFDPQGQTFQQYDAEGQPIQSYNNQVQYNQQYGWNNEWNNYGYQQTWNAAEQPTSASNEVPLDQSINSDTQSNGEIQDQYTGNSSDIISGNELGDSTRSFGSEASVKTENIVGNNENNIPYSGNYIHEGVGLSLEPEINFVPQTYHPEISNESLVTLNSSSTQMAEDNSLLNIENQMNTLAVQDKINTGKGDVNHSAVDGQGLSTETNQSKTSKDSPVNSQTSDDWEMIPSAQNLLAPTSHSRQGSMDSSSNVHFFIGSTNISPSNTPASNEDANQPNKKKEDGSPQSSMIPKHASSPMPPKSDIPKSSVDEPPSSAVLGQGPPVSMPPLGSQSTVTNPFRKENRSGQHGGAKFEGDTTSKNDGLKLDITAAESGFPSPIPAASEDSQNLPTQSPIMPRKESPFQPPRRRNLSQSSNSFDDENLALLSDERHVSVSKSEHIPKENNMDVKLGGMDRRVGPMKADRSIGSIVQSAPERHRDAKNDYNKYSYRGKDERRPRSPLTSNSARNISGRTTPTKPPTGRTTPGRITPSRRIEREAYQKVVDRRRKETVSPATSLWATNDVVPKTNILLAPAAPLQATTPVLGLTGPKHGVETRQVLSPVENLITSMSDHLSRESSPEKDLPKSKSSSNNNSRRENTQKERHERNSSIDREIEMTKRMEDKERLQDNSRDRSYRDYKDDRNNKGSVRDDRNPAYRDDRYRDRDLDRERYYEAYYERQRNNRSRDPYYDERYERPRSRQSTIDGQEQPTEKSRNDRDAYNRDRYGQRVDGQEQSIEKSRNDGDAYYRDRYGQRVDGQEQSTEKPRNNGDAYNRDRYGQRGYYDYYGRQYGGYYDQRYADYYGDSRYSKAYYDEYYGVQNQENYDRMSRYDYTWQNAGYYDQYRHDDTYSQRSDSRVHTPGSLSDSGDQIDGYNRGSRTSSRQGYPEDYQRGHYDPYYYGYQDYYNNSYTEPEPPGRMTPEKYTLPHMCARFGPGGHLIKVMPNRPKEGQTATVEIHDINTMLEDRPEVEELKCFPGPLVRGDTHKNDVLSFCQQRSKACSENITMTDRDSAELIWKLLELLIKQNGMIVGTDISDLLLEGHETTTVEYSLMGMKISNSMDNLDIDMDETNEISNVTMDRSVVNRGQRSREEVTDRFRHLLLYGRKKDALEWAMKNNLWGHALFLASKMDNKAHANVMTRFANSAMKMNDPLQTLYQLMSCRQPAAVSCITDEKWGDWRPHLAMMLSNQTHKTDQDRKYIMTMGDTLASKGFLHASHFCYLIAQVGFGSYHKKTSKMVLIGSSHSLPLSEFATNEAIQCSEVYEYAMSLGNASFFSPNLQYFKFLYACRMAENGFAQQALEYCEVIAKCINISPTVFQPTLVKLVYELASRLKKFDPEKQQVGEDSDDPMWLQHLQRINQGFEDGSIQPLSGSATPYCFVGTRSSSASGEVAGLTDMGGIHSGSLTGGSPYQHGQQQQIYNQGYTPEQTHNQMYSNDQNQYHHEYANNQTPNQAVTDPMHDQNQFVDQGYSADQSHFQGQGHQSSQNQAVDQNQLYTNQGQGYSQQGQGYSQPGQGNTDQELNYSGQGQTYQPQQTDPQQNQQYYTQDGQTGYQYQQQHDLQTVPEVTNQNQVYNTENQTGETTTNNYPPRDFSMYHQTGLHPGQRHNSISSASTMSSHGDVEDDESMNQSHTKSDFDYFGAATNQQKIVAPRMRKRTESENSQVNAPKSSESKTTEIKQEEKKDKKNQSQSKGWFGGVFSKLMPKSKNEMKLPDDKNPAIVWDPVKKRWINPDGEEEEEKPTAPPPKDMDLSSGSTPGHFPAASASTPAMGPPAGNRYGRPRGRGARTQYVDVMNPKSTGGSDSVPSNLFHVMPTSASSPAIFNPSHGKDATDSSQPETNSAQPNMPPSDQRIDSGERDNTEMPPPSSGPPSMPMLFNPSQVTQSSSTTATQSGLKRYNQRRVYPKS